MLYVPFLHLPKKPVSWRVRTDIMISIPIVPLFTKRSRIIKRAALDRNKRKLLWKMCNTKEEGKRTSYRWNRHWEKEVLDRLSKKSLEMFGKKMFDENWNPVLNEDGTQKAKPHYVYTMKQFLILMNCNIGSFKKITWVNNKYNNGSKNDWAF